MTARRGERGFSLLELLVSSAVLMLAMASLSGLMLRSSRINRAQQITTEVQSNAAGSLSMIVERLRSAGWDPLNVGLDAVRLDDDPADEIEFLEVFADLNADGDAADPNEAILIRHIERRIEWRTAPGEPFVVLAANISNDADGDGVREPMFTANSATDPTEIAVRITSESPVPLPHTGQRVRHTARTRVTLRGRL